MSKKSYKRNQNRLYREIKRRIIAEQASWMTAPVTITHKNFETIAIKNIVNDCYIEIAKTEMANEIVRKLIAEGYIEFISSANKYQSIADITEIEARLCVVKPTNMLKEELHEKISYY